MLDALDKKLLKTVADLEGLPKGAYNIRKNGKLLQRQVSANINIETNAEGTGVILSQAGLFDVVYNAFIIGEGAEVTIIAGCGIHCGSIEPEGHAGIHDFQVEKKAKVTYVEKHFAMGEGKGRRTLNPTTKVFLDEGATAEMELTQISGVDEANRLNEATLGPGSLLLITERVLTEGEQKAVSTNNIILQGSNSRANMISRSVMKGNSKQIFHANMEAWNKCFGHIECDAIIMDNGTNETMPALKADAELTHESSIGKIANDQLTKLMSLGLTYDQAVNRIIQGFLK
jgi:Fe-S cluster assembly scaffold protein SufB